MLARRSHPNALARLQARVAALYQLSAAEFQHILDTFPLVPSAAVEEFVTTQTPRVQK